MATHSVTDNSFETEVLKANGRVLVDFWAEWCGPCKAIAPVLEELSEEIKNVKIVKINIDENPQTPQKYRIRSIPTMILFQDGQVVDSKIGSLPKSALSTWLTAA